MTSTTTTWLDQVQRLRAHLDATRHDHASLRERAANGENVARWLADAETDIRATLARLSDLAAF